MMHTALFMVGLMPSVLYALAQDADTMTVTMTTIVYDCPEPSTGSSSSETCSCDTSSPSGQDQPTGTLTIYSTSSSTVTITMPASPGGIPPLTDSSGYMTTITSTDTDGVPATLVETCWAGDDATGCMPLSTITASPIDTFTSVNYTTSATTISALPLSCSASSVGYSSESLSTSSSYSFPTPTSTGSPASTSPPYVTAGAASFPSGSRVGSILGALALVLGLAGGFA